MEIKPLAQGSTGSERPAKIPTGVYRARTSALSTSEEEICLQALRPSSEFCRDGQEMDYTIIFHGMSRL